MAERSTRRKQSTKDAKKRSTIGRGTSSIVGISAQGSLKDLLDEAPDTKDRFHELIEMVVAEHDRQVEELRDGKEEFWNGRSSTVLSKTISPGLGSPIWGSPRPSDPGSRLSQLQSQLGDVLAPPQSFLSEKTGTVITSSTHDAPSLVTEVALGDSEDKEAGEAMIPVRRQASRKDTEMSRLTEVTEVSRVSEVTTSRYSEITEATRCSEVPVRRGKRCSTFGMGKVLPPSCLRSNRRCISMPASKDGEGESDVLSRRVSLAVERIRNERRSTIMTELTDDLNNNFHRDEDDELGMGRHSSASAVMERVKSGRSMNPVNETPRKSMLADERPVPAEFVTRDLWKVQKAEAHMPLPKSSINAISIGPFVAEEAVKKQNSDESKASKSIASSKSAAPAPMDWINRNFYVRALISYPSSLHRLLWDLMGLLFLLADIVLLPLEAFEDKGAFDDYYLNATSMVFWTCDMPLCLFVGYICKGRTEMRFSKIFGHYIRTWFPVDVIVNGLDWTFLIMANHSGVFTKLGSHIRLVRFLRMIRLVRMFKMTRVVAQINDRFTSEYLSIIANIFKLVLLLLLVNHVIACLWYWLGTINREDTWTKRFQFESASLAWCYYSSLHWSLTQFTPGSMDLQPQNENERLFNVGVLVFGLIVFSGFVSSMTNHFMRLKALVSDQSQQFWLLRCYLRHNNIPPNLSARIHRHVEFWMKHHTQALSQNSVRLLDVISKDLRNELNFELLKEPLLVHPFFANLVKLSDVVAHRLCESTIHNTMFMRHDHLFFAGEVACATFLMKNGRALYHKMPESELEDSRSEGSTDTFTSYLSGYAKATFSNNSCIQDLGKFIYVCFGYVLCEPSLWTEEWVHCGKLTVTAESDIVSIGADGFAQVLKNSPSVLGFTRHYSQNYVRWLNSLPRADLTDVVNIEYEMWNFSSFLPEGDSNCQIENRFVGLPGMRGLFANLIRTSQGSASPGSPRLETIRSFNSSLKGRDSVAMHHHGTSWYSWVTGVVCSCRCKRSHKSEKSVAQEPTQSLGSEGFYALGPHPEGRGSGKSDWTEQSSGKQADETDRTPQSSPSAASGKTLEVPPKSPGKPAGFTPT